SHAYGAGALISLARGDVVEGDRLQDILLSIASEWSARAFGWLTRSLIERGRIAEASRLIHDAPTSWRVHAAEALEAKCEFVAAAGSWSDAETIASECRAYTSEAHALVVPIFADRLEARAALARGDTELGVSQLERTATAFDERRAPWEAAVTRIDLARALIDRGRTDEAMSALDAADEVFERLDAARDAAPLAPMP